MSRAGRITLLLAGAHALATADRMLIALLTEPMRLDLGLSDTQVGLVGGLAFAILYAAAAIPMAALVDRVPRHRLLAALALVWSLATAGCGLATSFAGIAASRALLGVAQAGLLPAAMTILAATLPRARLGRGVAMFTGGASIGRSLGLMVGGGLLTMYAAIPDLATAPWRAVCLTLAAFGIALAPLLLALVPRDVAAVAAPRPGGVAAAWRHIRNRAQRVMPLIAAGACVVICTGTLGAWAPALFARVHGLSVAQSGLAVGAAVLVAAPLGHAIGGSAVDRATRAGEGSPAVRVTAVGLIAGVCASVLMIVAPSWPLALAALFGATAAFTIGVPATLAAVQLRTPDTVRSGTSAVFLIVNVLVGSGVGPSITGALSDLIGNLPVALLIVLVAAATAGTACIWRGRLAVRPAR